MQVQNQLNAFIVLAAALWCILACVTMILQQYSTQEAVIQLWWVTVCMQFGQGYGTGIMQNFCISALQT
jgi:hypothetical protein